MVRGPEGVPQRLTAMLTSWLRLLYLCDLGPLQQSCHTAFPPFVVRIQ